MGRYTGANMHTRTHRYTLLYAKDISKKSLKNVITEVSFGDNWYTKGQVQEQLQYILLYKNVWVQNNKELTCIKMGNHASYNIVEQYP